MIEHPFSFALSPDSGDLHSTRDMLLFAFALILAAVSHAHHAGQEHLRSNLRQAIDTELLELLFSRTRPDVVTLELLGWMTIDDLLAMLDRSVLDPVAVQAAEDARDELKDVQWGPFTQQTHEEVYSFCIETVRRLSPQTAVSVCHGTRATWQALDQRMKMSPENYICNCGPISTPGAALYDKWNNVTQQPD